MTIKLKSKGFTVVETLIVLSVTAVLFVSTSLLIQGQIERYRYRDSIFRTQQTLQTIINDTQNGYFPTLTNGMTTDTGNSISASSRCGIISSVQGQSQNCIIAGVRVLLCSGPSGIGSACSPSGPNTIPRSNVSVRKQLVVLRSSTDLTACSEGGDYFSDDIRGCWYVDVENIPYPNGLLRGKVYWPGISAPTDSDTAFTIVFSNINNTAPTASQQSVIIKNANAGADMSSLLGGGGQTVCLEGQQKGSVTFGKNGSLNIETNMDDSNC
ncbi:hypothetical protein KA025_01950 [Candidatus Saccharibacteria bacterium]|nr:hypothetical protein [Candidatus Saccharibacteria bacterium]